MRESPTRLAWDSEHFGHQIARWDHPDLTVPEVAQLQQWMTDSDVACTYILVDPASSSLVNAIERIGGSLVDIRVTLRSDLSDVAEPKQSVSVAGPDDVDALRDIALISHRDGRFHADHRLDSDLADRMYGTWLVNSVVNGFADVVHTIRIDEVPTGYVSSKKREDGSTELSLIAVSPTARGRGIGRELVHASMRWGSETDATSMDVVTQGRNVPALNLYQAAGFRIKQVALWFHVWRSPVAGSNA